MGGVGTDGAGGCAITWAAGGRATGAAMGGVASTADDRVAAGPETGAGGGTTPGITVCAC